jgi:hypothetical protein
MTLISVLFHRRRHGEFRRAYLAHVLQVNLDETKCSVKSALAVQASLYSQ